MTCVRGVGKRQGPSIPLGDSGGKGGRAWGADGMRGGRPQGNPSRLLLCRRPGRLKFQGSRVDAVTQPRWFRAIGKDMAKVSAAVATKDFDSLHHEAVILIGANVRLLDRSIETRPTGAGVEFRIGAEQRRSTADAPVEARRLGMPVLSGKGPLRPLLSSDLELLRRQDGLPLGFRFGKRFLGWIRSVRHGGSCPRKENCQDKQHLWCGHEGILGGRIGRAMARGEDQERAKPPAKRGPVCTSVARRAGPVSR